MSAIRPSPNRVQPPPSPEEDAEQKEIRQRLMQRLAIAVCLIVVAALAITFLNRFEQKPTVSTEGPAINPLQAETPSEPAPAASTPAAANTEVTPTISIGPDPETGSGSPEGITSPPDIENPAAPLPQINNTGAPAASSKPGDAQVELAPFDPDGGSTDAPPTNMKPSKPAIPTPAPAPAKTTPTTASNKPSPTNDNRPPRAEIANTASTQPSSSPPIIAPPPRAARAPVATPEQTIAALAAGVQPAGTRGFTVQAGVFQSGSNAEKLISRLSSAGIPARLETRVQIGPFKSREEADLMMRRLREMGVTPILQAPAPQ